VAGRRDRNTRGGNVVDFVPPEIIDDRDVLLTRREAARYLRKSIPTLERWARQGVGPKPIKIGRIPHYRLHDLRVAGGAS
jgi:hypothetical protein